MIVTEALPDGSYRESTVRQRYEYPFPLELKEVFAWVVDGKVPKISQVHARKDLEAFGDLYEGCCELNHPSSLRNPTSSPKTCPKSHRHNVPIPRPTTDTIQPTKTPSDSAGKSPCLASGFIAHSQRHGCCLHRSHLGVAHEIGPGLDSACYSICRGNADNSYLQLTERTNIDILVDVVAVAFTCHHVITYCVRLQVDLVPNECTCIVENARRPTGALPQRQSGWSPRVTRASWLATLFWDGLHDTGMLDWGMPQVRVRNLGRDRAQNRTRMMACHLRSSSAAAGQVRRECSRVGDVCRAVSSMSSNHAIHASSDLTLGLN
ncbi:hypothetical protein IQ06DRAFT_310015 [Phaeosphaeriaceae sp. SRC1lsM3a]|nr:hypothetical protein IQ06DRAFT_310015 [Stagonospora sp. SRC1lsM3a]